MIVPKSRLSLAILAFGVAAMFASHAAAVEQAGTAAEPVRYTGHEVVSDLHHGGLRLAVGVKSWQAFRANREYPGKADGFGWTYNHAPMLAFWNNQFFIEYLSNPVSENEGPGHTLMMASPDGVHWHAPRVIFPVYRIPERADASQPAVARPENLTPGGTFAQTHQRMGFHISSDDRLLVLAFYGLPNHPNDGRGIGRVVREVHRDGSLGPIYFIRYNRHNGWNESNTQYPFFEQSSDEAFKRACRELLADKLATLQWWEEDRASDGFYPDMNGAELKAFSYYHRSDGTVVGLWKGAMTALSHDEGKTWTAPVKSPSLVMAQAKAWGQRTPDGRYALIYNPRADNRHRWPLAIVTSEDGIHFDKLLTIQGEVPPRRYNGLSKAFGPQYNRGITEGNGMPPGNAIWNTYSMNKEDIWISRIPVPVQGTVTGPVQDTFDEGTFEDLPWNTYSPLMAPVVLDDSPGVTGRCLKLEDRDPADYAAAVRVFPGMKKGTVRFKLLAAQVNHGRLEIELFDRHGDRPPIRLFLDDKAQIRALDVERMNIQNLTNYAANAWYDIAIRFDVGTELFTILVNGRALLKDAEMLFPADSLERLSFRTGVYRPNPTLRDPKAPGEDFPGADEPEATATYYLDDVTAFPDP